MQRIAELQGQYEAKNKDEEEAYQLKKKTYDLLPNADENIAKLQVGGWGVKTGMYLRYWGLMQEFVWEAGVKAGMSEVVSCDVFVVIAGIEPIQCRQVGEICREVGGDSSTPGC